MPKRKKLIDIIKGIYVKVDGEEGADHTLSWDVLRKIGDSLSDLVDNLLADNATENDPAPGERYKLEFTGLYKGSSIAGFAAVRELQMPLYPEGNLERKVKMDFSSMLSDVTNPEFFITATKVSNKATLNVLESLYHLSRAAGTSPVSIVTRVGKTKKFLPAYDLSNIASPKYLIGPPQHLLGDYERVYEEVATIALAEVELKKTSKGRSSTKIREIYSDSDATISVQLDSISHKERTYVFSSPIIFRIIQEDGGVVIENEQLDIYAAGDNMAAARSDLADQFDHSFRRLKELDEEVLGKDMLRVKRMLELVVSEIKINPEWQA